MPPGAGVEKHAKPRQPWALMLTPNFSPNWCRSRTLEFGLAATIVLGSCPSLAGPPLVLDDPHTVGAGQVELIVAVEALDQGRETRVGPTLDVTLGVFEGLDATLVVTPFWEFRRGMSTRVSEFVEAGIKWQPVMTSSWNVSFSPALATTIAGKTELEFALPVQIEYAVSDDFALGVDAAFSPVAGGADAWGAGSYATWQSLTTLALLAEVWASGTASGRESMVGLGGGIDWEAPSGLHVFAAAGTGVASEGVRRVDWYSYLGVLWAFEAW